MAVLRVYAENIHTNWKGSLGKRQTLTLHHCVSIFKPPWPLPLFFIYSQLQLLNACSSYPQSVLYNNFHAINGSLLQIGQGKQFSLSVQESDKAGKASQQMKLWTERKGCRNTGAWKKRFRTQLGSFPHKSQHLHEFSVFAASGNEKWRDYLAASVALILPRKSPPYKRNPC